MAKLENAVVNLSARLAQRGPDFAQPQPSSAEAEAAAAAAKEALAQKWMREIVMKSMRFNSLKAMTDFNEKLEKEDEAPYMKAAAEQLAPFAKQATCLSKFYQIVFGDWVTDNVSYARATVNFYCSFA